MMDSDKPRSGHSDISESNPYKTAGQCRLSLVRRSAGVRMVRAECPQCVRSHSLIPSVLAPRASVKLMISYHSNPIYIGLMVRYQRFPV